MTMDRDILFEKLLDNLELYFEYKRDLNRKVKACYAEGDLETDVYFWQEYEVLDNLRMLTRRALDEDVMSAPGRADEPEPR